MKVIRGVLSALTAALIVVSSSYALPSIRIVDGNTVSESEYPHVARLTVDGEMLCTGTLISSRFILTAAHCFFGDDNKRAVGDTTIVARLNGTEYNTVKAYIHPDYKSRSSACVEGEVDAAVLELASDVTVATPAPLLETPVPVGSTVTLVGYGNQGTGSAGQNNSIPSVGSVNVGTTVVEGFGDNVGVQNTNSTYFYWTFNSGEANTASGDSGGPAFYESGGTSYLAGLTCGGGGNAEFGTDSFDTRVDTIVAWVQSIAGITPAETPPSLDAVKSQRVVLGKAMNYRLPVMGSAPLTTTMTNLPDGLSFDGANITGTPTTKGDYVVSVASSNAYGSASKDIVMTVDAVDATLTVKKVLLQFDYSDEADDFLDVSGKITVGKKFIPKGKSVVITIGRFSKTFKLRPNGESAGSGKSFFDLAGEFKGKSFKKSVIPFALTLERESLAEALSTLGFPASADASAGQVVALPISITINGVEAAKTVNLKFREKDSRWIISK
jgi:Trypsin